MREVIESGRVSGLARELAWQSGLQSVSSDQVPVWSLMVEHDSLTGEGVVQTLASALGAQLGLAVQLEICGGRATDTPAQRESQRRQERVRQAEAHLAADEEVQALLGQFKTARIVPGSVKPGAMPGTNDVKKGRSS